MTSPLARPARPRSEFAPLAALLAAALMAWVLTGWTADAHMRVGVLTGDGDMSMSMPARSMALGAFLVTWTIMMVAMMFPAMAPVVLLFRRWARDRGRSSTTVAAFVAGYLAVWAGVGILAYSLVALLQEAGHPGSDGAVRVGGVFLLAAGVYQLTPLKDACLKHCRSPLSIIMTHSRRLSSGHRGPFEIGVVHGSYCLGCCWGLMVVLTLLGMMSLAWMATVAVVIFAEKVLPGGRTISRGVGVFVAVAGLILVLAPTTLPAAPQLP